MRILSLEIKNFKGFYGTYNIELHQHNLLVYGDNGSGKTSLFMALKLFLEASVKDHVFEKYQNIFIPNDEGYVKLHIQPDPSSSPVIYEWSKKVNETNNLSIMEANKAKGFFDYKGLLETYFLHRTSTTVNLFNLLVKTLLANSINDFTKQNFADDWTAVQRAASTRKTKEQIQASDNIIQKFNDGFTSKLAELKVKAVDMLKRFGYEVRLDFDFAGISYNEENRMLKNKEVILKVTLFNKAIPKHHLFLNEAKLSAIALSIYFASLLQGPSSRLKILALDDVLIGLDMSNRLPILEILESEFSDYQIFLLTYDKQWYEIVKETTQLQKKWEYAHLYCQNIDEHEIVVYSSDNSDNPYLDKAKEYFKANDYKACAIYLRTAFESIVKDFCLKNKLLVTYHDPKNPQIQYFWNAVTKGKDRNKNPWLTDDVLIQEINFSRRFLLNPLSHSETINVHKSEIERAIKAIEQLENELKVF
jgi:hypothetical protein